MQGRLGILALAALLVAAEAAAQAPSYAVFDLGRLPGAFTTQPLGINDNGEVVGYTQGPFTQLRAFVWRNGTLVELPPPPGYTDNRATDISDNGIITGAAQNGIEGLPRGWRWRNGVYELLPLTLDGCGHLFPNAVNDDGTVVGITQSNNAGTCPSRAFYYSDTLGLIDLTTLFNAIDAQDVNNQGIATGEGFDSAYRYSPALGYQSIGTLPGYEDGAQGNAINDLGEVAGFSIHAVTGPDAWEAFLWRNGVMLDLTTTIYFKSAAADVNDQSHVVGNDGTSSTPEQYAWIWTDQAGRREIPDLVTQPNGFVSIRGARGIDNADRIIAKAGRDDPSDGYGYGVILVPATAPPPLPAPSAGVCCGPAAGEGARRRKMGITPQ